MDKNNNNHHTKIREISVVVILVFQWNLKFLINKYKVLLKKKQFWNSVKIYILVITQKSFMCKYVIIFFQEDELSFGNCQLKHVRFHFKTMITWRLA